MRRKENAEESGNASEEEEAGNRLFALSCDDDVVIEMRKCGGVAAAVLAEQIGRFEPLSTPFGVKPLVYADWTASARSLRHIEAFLSRQVLPYYGNTHTAASSCGAQSSSFVAEARRVVGEFCGARVSGKAACDVVLFCGAGTTSAVNQLVSILGVAKAVSPVVLVGPYEHHSNLLPWREAGAVMETVLGDITHGVNLVDLEKRLLVARPQDRPVIGAFCAVPVAPFAQYFIFSLNFDADQSDLSNS
jgi:selenocysteine lyase/cysteine desulfurase